MFCKCFANVVVFYFTCYHDLTLNSTGMGNMGLDTALWPASCVATCNMLSLLADMPCSSALAYSGQDDMLLSYVVCGRVAQCTCMRSTAANDFSDVTVRRQSRVQGDAKVIDSVTERHYCPCNMNAACRHNLVNQSINQSIFFGDKEKLVIIKCNSIITVNQDAKVWCTLTGARIVHRELIQYNDTVQ